VIRTLYDGQKLTWIDDEPERKLTLVIKGQPVDDGSTMVRTLVATISRENIQEIRRVKWPPMGRL
jgi:hypothetical protein